MKNAHTYLFEVLPDGSIGARYFFDTRDPVPDQPVRPGARMLTRTLTGDEPDRVREEVQNIRVRAQDYEVKDGTIIDKERSGEGRR